MVRLTIITDNTQTAVIRTTVIQAIANLIQGIAIRTATITGITKGDIALNVVIDNA